MENEYPRVSFIMVDENTLDNLLYVREKMEKEYKLHPETISEVIEILLEYYCKGKKG